MPKKIENVAADVLINAPLPAQTKTYTVISHKYAIETIRKTLIDNGFDIESEEYRCTTNAKVAHGTFIIKYQGDPDLGLIYSFSNSYDKTLRFRAAIGAHVYKNGAFMISEMDSWLRKHTGAAGNETEELIKQHITNADELFEQLKEAKDAMKNITIDRSEFGKMIGYLFMNGYLAIDQMSLIQKEYDNPSFQYEFGSENLWTCYNHIVNALRQSHPSKWMQNQVAVHLYFASNYNLVSFDEEESTLESVSPQSGPHSEPILPGIHDGVEEFPILPGFENYNPVKEIEKIIEETIDPNQVDLEDSIAEVKSQAELSATVNLEETSLPEKFTGAGAKAEERTPNLIPEEEVATEKFDQVMEEQKRVDPAPVPLMDSKDLPECITHTKVITKEEVIEEYDDNLLEEQKESINNMLVENSEMTLGEDIGFDPQPEELQSSVGSEAEFDESPFKEIPGDSLPQPKAEEKTQEISEEDIIYFSKDDYPELKPGEFIELEGTYYEMVREDKDGSNILLACIEVPVEDETLAEQPLFEAEPVISGTESPEEEAEVKQVLAEESFTEEIESAEEMVELSLEELGASLVGINEVEINRVEKIKEYSEQYGYSEEDILAAWTKALLGKDDSNMGSGSIKRAIAQELEDIYGYNPEFTYEAAGSQYNVKLETGETVVLAAAYIDGIATS